ncbi:MAG: hypothetical protein KBT11_08085 [Treponema sp.]|nr:hypothetical protein [Candidatus Treponema equifaecale]
MKTRTFLAFFLIFSIFASELNAQNFVLRRGGSAENSNSTNSEKVEEKKEAVQSKEKSEVKAENNIEETEKKSSENEAKISAAENESQNAEQKPKKEKVPFEKDIFFTFGPMLMVNTDSTSKSAPSPVMYAGAIGGEFFSKNSISAQTRFSFFTNYYLWDGEVAQPAEIENRTAIALSFLLDLCGNYNWFNGKNQFSLGAGLGILARFGILCEGVDPADKNPLTGTEASDDVNSINSDFFANMNFLYPEIVFSYLREISPKWKAGVETRAYLPLGSLINGNGADGMMVSLALKLVH